MNTDTPDRYPSLREAFGVWLKIGLNSFGGPAGQIAIMHRVLVEEKRWIDERRFLHALNYCMLLPGPEAQQLATYIGWMLHRTLGGLIAGGLFVLPGAIAMLILSVLYARFNDLAIVEGIFFGIKPAVMAIVVEAVLRIGRRALRNNFLYAMAAAAFVGIFFFEIPFPVIVAAAGLIGFLGGRSSSNLFQPAPAHAARSDAPSPAAIEESMFYQPEPSTRRFAVTLLLGLSIWFLPVPLIAWFGGIDSVFMDEAMFFSKAAVVTFGGAYAVLAYLAQRAVETYGWLAPGEMLDGLGMAETTPGPLIMVVQFVGFMGAYRNPGTLDPVIAGTLGALITTWVTFVPCFLWIFLGAPYIEKLRDNRSLTNALTGITAAVVGVILNLAVWFSIHTLFRSVEEFRLGPMRLLVPQPETLDWPAAAIAVGAAIAVFRYRVGMIPLIAVSAGVGVLYVLLARIV